MYALHIITFFTVCTIVKTIIQFCCINALCSDGGDGGQWCAEQVFSGMRRNYARSSYWDAESDHRSDREHNNGILSPRSPLAGDHLLGSGGSGGGGGGGGGADSRNTKSWNKDDRFGEQQVGGSGDGVLLPCVLESGDKSPRSKGSVVGVDGSQLLEHQAHGGAGAAGGGGGGHGHTHHGRGAGGGGGGGGGGNSGNKRYGGGGGVARQRRIFLRIHKFVFQKELAMHFSMCILSIAIPFSLSGSPWLAAIPLSVWCFYNAMFVVGAKRAGAVLPGFDRFKRSFVAAMEEFLPPRLVPVLSLSFLSVLIAITLTAAKLGGPPLCLSSCHACLGSWKHAHLVALSGEAPPLVTSVPIASSRDGVRGRGLSWGIVHDRQLDSRLTGSREWGADVRAGAEGAVATTRSVLNANTGQACGYANGKVKRPQAYD